MKAPERRVAMLSSVGGVPSPARRPSSRTAGARAAHRRSRRLGGQHASPRPQHPHRTADGAVDQRRGHVARAEPRAEPRADGAGQPRDPGDGGSLHRRRDGAHRDVGRLGRPWLADPADVPVGRRRHGDPRHRRRRADDRDGGSAPRLDPGARRARMMPRRSRSGWESAGGEVRFEASLVRGVVGGEPAHRRRDGRRPGPGNATLGHDHGGDDDNSGPGSGD